MLSTIARRAAAQSCLHAHLGRQSMTTAAQIAAVQTQVAADRQDLINFFPTVVEEVRKASLGGGIPEESEWLAKVLRYNTPRGRMFRGCAAINACRELVSKENAHLGLYLGCTAEMLQTVYIIVDDLVDRAELRRGQPCWYTLPGVGLNAINDAVLVLMSIYELLRLNFRSVPGYMHLVELFNATSFKCVMAQNYESHNSDAPGCPKFDSFDLEVHRAQARYKISYYMFYTPTASAMHLAGISDAQHHKLLWEIMEDIGLLFTVQDDYDDCYESEEKTGKSQGDISNGKCTWLIAEAKRRANHKQLAHLKNNYGRDDPANVAAVQDVFAQLGIKEAAEKFQRDAFQRIGTRIDEQQLIKPAVLHYVLNSIRQPFQNE